MADIGTDIKKNNEVVFKKNYSNYVEIIKKLNKVSDEIVLGGGKIAIEKQHSKGRLTASRVSLSTDFIFFTPPTQYERGKNDLLFSLSSENFGSKLSKSC